MSKPAIYHHFKSRDQIVETLMEPVFADTRAALEAWAPLDAAARAVAARKFYADFIVIHRLVISTVFFDRAALPSGLDAEVDRLADAIAVAVGAGDAAMGLAQVYGIAALVTRHRELSDSELSDEARRVLHVR
ncbi:hypothetical protein [Demequina capsici]|uniref:Transcriptional regulator, TetR family n=1 Tax=Demequina capsici TaxID=3075620 RepID=A0AA96F9V6_9MICO|nr:hypothetical protein [Demequina sp. OYTSA14]WNM26032.1 hypothetical protein RN606_09500 [Demequina sp. OYTSA14]